MASNFGNINEKNIKSKKWAKAFKQGHDAGYHKKEKLSSQSPMYRSPKFASLVWEAGYSQGSIERDEEENRGAAKTEEQVNL